MLEGLPVVAWDLFAPEFGLIYGYDDAAQLLYAEDSASKGTIPYDRFGRGMSGGLFLLSVTGEMPIEEWEAVRSSLDMAVRHAYGEWTFVGYVCGLTAYECWSEAFRRRSVDPLGNAYTAEVAADARRHAALFIRELERKLLKNGRKEAADMAAEAACLYEQIEAALGEFSRLFPFPDGGSPNEPALAEKAIGLLSKALAAETAGIEALERLSRCIALTINEEAGR
ncbi:hypothetical protein [Paenibacillus sp. MBLB4367]|uniref:hypothetical protein n=1 Tax=Paenibacillus sp. MBLB4367 TaxID=3384767 RepID=UPI0039082B59